MALREVALKRLAIALDVLGAIAYIMSMTTVYHGTTNTGDCAGHDAQLDSDGSAA